MEMSNEKKGALFKCALLLSFFSPYSTSGQCNLTRVRLCGWVFDDVEESNWLVVDLCAYCDGEYNSFFTRELKIR